jgi:nitrate reductase NapE component
MPTPNAKKRRVNRVKGFASRGRWKKWILLLLLAFLLIPAMQVALVRFRVKSFASRGLTTVPSEGVLRVRAAVRERRWFLHRFFHGLEEAAGRAYAGRFIRHEIKRSVEAYLL